MIPTGRLRRAGRLVGAALRPEAGVASLGQLKAGAQKLGQTMALVADGMPPGMRDRLGRLFAEAEPRPWNEVEPALAALPAGLLASVEEVPFAAASLGQVHRGMTGDGAPVAVKILYPGIREALLADLANLGTLTAPAALVEGAATMLHGLREALLAELDLRVEAAHARRMAVGLTPWPRIRVAAPVHATERVLVSELLEGPTLHSRLGPGPRAREIAEDLVAAVMGPVFSAGLVNADAHPGNFLLQPGGLGLVDFGATSPISDVADLAAALDAILAGHTDGALERLGIRAGPLAEPLSRVLAPLGPGDWDFARDTLLLELGEIKRRHPFALREIPFAADRLPLIRAVMGLHHALRRLEVRLPLGRVLADVRHAAGW